MTNRHARTATLFFLVTLALAGCADTDASPPAAEAITEESLRADVFALAHDSTRGRLVGTPELFRVADWIRDRFETLGLEPAGEDGTYDQPFEMNWFRLGEGSRLSIAGEDGARAPGQGWYPLNFSASTSAEGEVVFAGFGIDEPRLGFDDYRGGDVSGKVVLVLEREPRLGDPESPFDGLVTTEAARDWRKARAAQRRGAVGILLVRDAHNRPDVSDWGQAAASYWPDEPRRIERFTLREWMDGIEIPGAFISTEIAEALVAGSGASLADLGEAAETAANGHGVRPLPGARVSLTTAVDRQVTPARNVLAMARGSDPALRDEVVVIGAHHDHNGYDGDVIYNGADDNASGTAGLLALAEAFARAAEEGRRPRRSLLFVALDAEERGPALGAWNYTLHPPFPLENTAAFINLDMIGRDQEVPEGDEPRFRGLEPQTAQSNSNAVNLLGYSRSPDLARAAEAANAATGLTLRFRYDNNESNLLRRSEQWAFIQNDVPSIWFHTGLHPDYHTGEDVAERINYEKMTRIVRLAHRLIWDLADADGRPTIEPMGTRPPS